MRAGRAKPTHPACRVSARCRRVCLRALEKGGSAWGSVPLRRSPMRVRKSVKLMLPEASLSISSRYSSVGLASVHRGGRGAPCGMGGGRLVSDVPAAWCRLRCVVLTEVGQNVLEVLLVDEAVLVLVDHRERLFELGDLLLIKHGEDIGRLARRAPAAVFGLASRLIRPAGAYRWGPAERKA